jgi:hypothetical protein
MGDKNTEPINILPQKYQLWKLERIEVHLPQSKELMVTKYNSEKGTVPELICKTKCASRYACVQRKHA